MNDLIRFVCEQAIRRFGGRSDGIFNAACFAATWARVTGTSGMLDGLHVRGMLTGRPDIEILPGNSHFRLR